MLGKLGKPLKKNEHTKPMPYDALCSQTQAAVEVTDKPAYNKGTVKAIEYTGADYKGTQTKVFAYIGFPENASAEHKVPAVVLVHGGLGTAYYDWVQIWNKRGYAAIAMDTEGRRSDKSVDGLGGPQNDALRACEKPIDEQWMYHAVSSAVRGATVLLSDERVNKEKLGIVGVSWGSVIASIVLGVDNRYAFGIPIYGTGHLNKSLGWMCKLGISDKGFALWDPHLYFPFYTAKVHLVNSDHDAYFSANITSQSASDLNAGITYIAEHTHGHNTAWAINEVYAFADQVTQNKTILPKISACKLSDQMMHLRFSLPADATFTAIEVYCKKDSLKYYADTERSVALENDFAICDVPMKFDRTHGRADFNIPLESKLVYFNIVVNRNGETLRSSSNIIALSDDAIPQ